MGVLLALLAASVAGAQLGPQRGTWFWSDDEHPFGATRVVGFPDHEACVVEVFATWNVARSYCSLGNRPLAEPEVVAAWNARLADAGVASYLLLSENTWIFPENRGQLLDLVATRLVAFNASRNDPRERFTGLHLDIEPQALAEWSSLTPSERRDRLLLLADTFAAVRGVMDDNGAADLPVYAALPVWFDNLGGSVGWTSDADRDQWFAELAAALAGISLMAFERTTFASIQNGVQWEIDHFAGEARVALEVDVGAGQTWPDFATLEAMALQIEASWGPDIGVDLQSFTQLVDHAPPRLLFVDGLEVGDASGWSTALAAPR